LNLGDSVSGAEPAVEAGKKNSISNLSANNPAMPFGIVPLVTGTDSGNVCSGSRKSLI
jgi:hypothetical protein